MATNLEPNKTIKEIAGIHGMSPFTSGERVNHCKIVGTIGPASSDEKTLRALITAGMNIARLNFSHGDHETHLRNLQLIRYPLKSGL